MRFGRADVTPGRDRVAYDEKLAERVRTALLPQRGVSERKMFGGLAFLLRGNMLCGVVDRDLMVRVGPDGYETALARPHARQMDFTGRAMKGLVYVAPAGIRTGRQLESWLGHGLEFVASLPAKPAAGPREERRRGGRPPAPRR